MTIACNNPAGTVILEGKENDVSKIWFTFKNNKLIIHANRKNNFDELKIYLSATMLKHVLINGDGDISSTGIIKTDNLHIWLNGNVKVKINIIGNISVDAFNDTDLLWEPLLN